MIDIITYVILIVACIGVALIIAFPLNFLWKYIRKIIMATFFILVTNLIGISFNFSIGLNIITVLFCAFLGVPGYTTLILLNLLL